MKLRRALIGLFFSVAPAIATVARAQPSDPASPGPITMTSSSALSFAVRFGEVPRPRPSASLSAKPEPPRPSFAPEPAPLRSTRTWLYEIAIHEGKMTAAGPVAIDHARPVTTPRRLGRYAMELWIGKEILDRVRFDLPTLPDDAARWGRPNGTAQGTSHVLVEIPDSDRATFVVLVDRDTGKTQRVAFPPADYPPAPSVILRAPAASASGSTRALGAGAP